MTTRTFSKKKQQQSRVFFAALFFMFTLTWIKDKELERVIENKGDEFRIKWEMLAASKLKMSGSEK